VDQCNRAAPYIPDIGRYVAPVARLGRGPEFVNEWLPVQLSEEDNSIRVLVDADEWETVLVDCRRRAKTDEEFEAMLAASLRTALRRRGIDHRDCTDPRVIEAVDKLKHAPDFIRDADHLSLSDKVWLWEAEADLPPEALEAAKRDVCGAMRIRYDILTGKTELVQSLSPEQQAELMGRWFCTTIADLFRQHVDKCRLDRATVERDQLFADREVLTGRLIEEFTKIYIMRTGIIGGRPALEVMRERLDALPRPELVLLASYILEQGMAGPSSWLQELKGSYPSMAGDVDKEPAQ